MDFMKQYKDETYALLRIVSGFLFIFHGIPKMSAIFAGTANWMTMIAGPKFGLDVCFWDGFCVFF